MPVHKTVILKLYFSNQDNPIIYRLPSEKKETMIYKSETT